MRLKRAGADLMKATSANNRSANNSHYEIWGYLHKISEINVTE